MTSPTKSFKRRLNRSAGPEDVRPGWLMESAIRSIGPYIHYGDVFTTDRRTGKILWRIGDDPAKRPQNPEPETFIRKVHTRRGL
jgi:hypothetical protein